jgi:hypothetical protein
MKMKTTEAGALSKSYRELVEAAAEAAYDQWYNVTPATSGNAWVFERHEELREEWRNVARAMLEALEGIE